MRTLTVHVIHLEQELKFVRLAAVNQQVQSFEQLIQTDGAAAVRVEQCEEAFGEERLHDHPHAHAQTQKHIYILQFCICVAF